MHLYLCCFTCFLTANGRLIWEMWSWECTIGHNMLNSSIQHHLIPDYSSAALNSTGIKLPWTASLRRATRSLHWSPLHRNTKTNEINFLWCFWGTFRKENSCFRITSAAWLGAPKKAQRETQKGVWKENSNLPWRNTWTTQKKSVNAKKC